MRCRWIVLAPAAEAKRYSRSALFTGPAVPVLARFPVAGGRATTPDPARQTAVAQRFTDNRPLDGVEASPDPMLRFRSAAYAPSFSRRTVERAQSTATPASDAKP